MPNKFTFLKIFVTSAIDFRQFFCICLETRQKQNFVDTYLRHASPYTFFFDRSINWRKTRLFVDCCV